MSRLESVRTAFPRFGKCACYFSKVRKIQTILVFCLATTAQAQMGEPMPTRWRGPGERPIPPPCPPQPYSLCEVDSYAPRAPLSYEPGRPATGRIAVLVATNIYTAVSNAVRTYTRDLASNGFSTITLTFSGSAEELRAVLSNYYYSAESLKGAMLVGEMPYAVWEMLKSFNDGTTNYAADLADIFFMDLDGVWADTNSTSPFAAGRYDTRSGNLELEIWVSRLRGRGITAAVGAYTNEVTILTNYFHRLHQYRITNMVMNKKGLTYTDTDWNNYKLTDQVEMQACYPTDVVSRAVGVDTNPPAASGIDFRDAYMTQNVEMIQIRCHGNAIAQIFDDGTSISYTTWTNKDPKAVFYNIYGCSGGDFLTTNNIARIAIFNRDANGLVSWSHSGEGGMIGFWGYKTRVFFDTLGEGETVGEAFRRWYNGCVAADQIYYPEYWMTPKWWNGMILNGDGALTVRTPRYLYVATNGAHVAPFTSWANAATSVHAAFNVASVGDVVLVGEGTYQMTSALHLTSSKTITLRGVATNQGAILRAAPGTNIIRVTDGYMPVIENLTLTGGHSTYGGAAYMAGGILRNCYLVNNTGTWAGGGAYLNHGRCRVENCRIENNHSPGNTGGGLIVMVDGAVIEDCVIAGNSADTGGGVSLTWSGNLVRCSIVNNRATGNVGGGGVYVVGEGAQIWNCAITGNVSHSRGGGVMMYRGWLLNSLVADNVASNSGGGVFSQGYTNTARLGSFIQNCTIAGNSSTGLGCGVYATQYTYVVNSVIYSNGADDWHNAGGNEVVVNYSCFGEFVPGVSNLNANPLFVGGGDYRLQAGSPCIDAATGLTWHAGAYDLANMPRQVGVAVDLGAYEYQGEGVPDTDNDGMPDWWEILYGLNPNSPTDALGHADADEVCNLDEYIADTSPINATSFFRIRDLVATGVADIVFNCSTARWYSLERAPLVGTGDWAQVAGQTNVPGVIGGTLTLTDTNAPGDEVFYRVRVRLP